MPELAAPASTSGAEKETMPTMGFLDHLEELRKRIVYSVIAVAVGFGLCWWISGTHLRGHAAARSWTRSTPTGWRRS